MARQQARKQFLNFVAGLNTESSPLSFKENTAKDLLNVDLNRDGSIQRRRGADFETGTQYSQTIFQASDLDTAAISAHPWKSVDGNSDLNFLVIQVGEDLFFHKLGAEITSTSIIGTLSLSEISTRTDFETYTISSTVGKGKLFIVSPGISPSYIQYDQQDDSFSGVKLTLRIRDTDGIDEQKDSPALFGVDVTPTNLVDPIDDINDTLIPVLDPDDFGEWEIIVGIF